MKRMIYVEPGRCLACKSCEMACAVAHSESKELFSALQEEPMPQSRVQVEGIEGYSVPLQCRHCEDAPCIKVCPTGAINRLSPLSPVLLNSEKCIGCKWCLMACPFGMIQVGREGVGVIKCDLCIERLARGEEPACVSGCPTGALRFLSPEEISKHKREATASELLQGL